MMARFCDFVLGFELEAENLYMKATSMLNSLKLQHSKGIAFEGDLEMRGRGQEFILSVECTPKCVDKVIFANQRLLNFLNYK